MSDEAVPAGAMPDGAMPAAAMPAGAMPAGAMPAGAILDVAIVGAGPVGLFLGALLLQEGISVRIFEQRSEPEAHSRAIGIHPPALAVLERAGVLPAMVAEGVAIRFGIARSGGRKVAHLPLGLPQAPYPFVLSLPQTRTEAILAARVCELDRSALVHGCPITAMHDDGTCVTLGAHPDGGPARMPPAEPTTARTSQPAYVAAGVPVEHRARIVVGADGTRSTVRRLAGIPTSVRNYPDNYLMGDFPDTGNDGPAAVLYLEPGGIVESFPLPGGLRRWVVHTQTQLDAAGPDVLARLIRERTEAEVDPARNSMLSAFGVRTRLARRMVEGRVALVGDAAHEISPIGGQGMNLGWLDAAALAPIIVAALAGESTGAQLAQFQRQRLRAARLAGGQAWLNMALGRGAPASYLNGRNLVLGQLLRLSPVQNLVSRRFTMQ